MGRRPEIPGSTNGAQDGSGLGSFPRTPTLCPFAHFGPDTPALRTAVQASAEARSPRRGGCTGLAGNREAKQEKSSVKRAGWLCLGGARRSVPLFGAGAWEQNPGLPSQTPAWKETPSMQLRKTSRSFPLATGLVWGQGRLATLASSSSSERILGSPRLRALQAPFPRN